MWQKYQKRSETVYLLPIIKEQIDAITGKDNLDFPFEKQKQAEFVIKITMPDGSHLFLPIYAMTDALMTKPEGTQRWRIDHCRNKNDTRIQRKTGRRGQKETRGVEAEQRAKMRLV